MTADPSITISDARFERAKLGQVAEEITTRVTFNVQLLGIAEMMLKWGCSISRFRLHVISLRTPDEARMLKHLSVGSNLGLMEVLIQEHLPEETIN